MLEVIRAAVAATGEPPAMRLIARRLGVHLSTVQAHVGALHRKGWLATPSPAGYRPVEP